MIVAPFDDRRTGLPALLKLFSATPIPGLGERVTLTSELSVTFRLGVAGGGGGRP